MADGARGKRPRGRPRNHKSPPPASPKQPVMLRVPCLSGSKKPVLASAAAPDESTALPLPQAPTTDKNHDTDMYMPPSPRQQEINQYWESHPDYASAPIDGPGDASVKEPNEAILHPQHGKSTNSAPSVSSGGKRKAETLCSDRASSVNLDGSDHDPGTASDLGAATPPPPRKKARRKSQKEEVEVVDSDDESDRPAKTQSKGKQSAKASRKACAISEDDEREETSYKSMFVLIIPQPGGSARRVELKLNSQYDDALELIHENIGCLDVNKKPELSYKLSSATAKTVAISLSSKQDWKGFQKEVIGQQKAKKRSIPVNIIVPERYLKSLEAMDPKKSQKSSSRSTKRKTTAPLMDLNGDSDDENLDDGTMEREKQALEQLERALSRCQLCGPGKFCKVSNTGEHVNLSFGQRRAWSMALANKQHGVTVMSPPRAEIFHMFFKTVAAPVTSTPTPAPAVHTPGMPPGMATPFSFMPWMMPPPPFSYPQDHNLFYSQSHGSHHSRSPPPRGSSSHRRSRYTQDDSPAMLARGSSSRRQLYDTHDDPQSSPTMASSDAPEEENDNSPYPLITDFLEKLDKKHPQRNLSRHFRIFEEKDFFHIEEVSHISLERLSSNEFGFTAGNAQYFLDQVQKEMKRVDHAIKRAKKKGKSH